MDYIFQCPKHEAGCTFSGNIDALAIHIKDEEKGCKLFKYECEACHQVMNERKITPKQHMIECPQSYTECKLCSLSLQNRELENHISNECPETPNIRCPYSKFTNCLVVKKRKDMKDHQNELLNHLQMASETYAELWETNQNQTEIFQKNLSYLKQQLKNAQMSITKLTSENVKLKELINHFRTNLKTQFHPFINQE